MLRRRKATLKDRVVATSSGAAETAASKLRVMGQRAPSRLDGYAAGAIGLGIANWLSMSVFNFDLVKAVAGRRSVSGRTAYGLLSLSAIYGAIRGARRAGR